MANASSAPGVEVGGRRQRRRRAALFPDGYWNPDKAEGGVGALLLLEGAQARATGAMVPQHLAAQLLAIEDGRVEAKVQRNTQTEFLAVLVALLAWSEELRGCELVIFDDSQAAEGNPLSGSATTAGSPGRRKYKARIRQLEAAGYGSPSPASRNRMFEEGGRLSHSFLQD